MALLIPMAPGIAPRWILAPWLLPLTDFQYSAISLHSASRHCWNQAPGSEYESWSKPPSCLACMSAIVSQTVCWIANPVHVFLSMAARVTLRKPNSLQKMKFSSFPSSKPSSNLPQRTEAVGSQAPVTSESISSMLSLLTALQHHGLLVVGKICQLYLPDA